MLAIAEERAKSLGLHNMDFKKMDAEALDFQENNFDAVLSRWGLIFLPNLSTSYRSIQTTSIAICVAG